MSKPKLNDGDLVVYRGKTCEVFDGCLVPQDNAILKKARETGAFKPGDSVMVDIDGKALTGNVADVDGDQVFVEAWGPTGIHCESFHYSEVRKLKGNRGRSDMVTANPRSHFEMPSVVVAPPPKDTVTTQDLIKDEVKRLANEERRERILSKDKDEKPKKLISRKGEW